MAGHVDGLVRVLERRTQGAFVELKLDLPQELERWVAPKGSVALDGVSLTVAWLEPAAFGVALIPETLARTTLGQVREGDELHFEADLLARYVVRALEVWTQRP
jgi:riboflavin synthase